MRCIAVDSYKQALSVISPSDAGSVWRQLMLLYDLTSALGSSKPADGTQARYLAKRDKRSDWVQVIIALVVTPEGLPMAYEVLACNTSDRTTLREFLNKIETQYGKAERIWVMDRGIPTEEVLTEMRQSDPPVYYLVGTPKGRLSQLEQKLLGLPFTLVRSGVEVKLLAHEQELYVLAKSHHRIDNTTSASPSAQSADQTPQRTSRGEI